ncbi:unnamed protein product [Brugia pahangi]|uniref:NifU_N domain-containing protein n=1 Tax=Brugia pahangi TaxID=6280 RepID=A0A0N4TYD2_BRUPA|nr:unnamed protein product [Brugia pahangi]
MDMLTISLKSLYPYAAEIQNQQRITGIYNKIVQILRNQLRTDESVLECGQIYNNDGYLSIRFRIRYGPDKCSDLRTLAATAVRLLDEVQIIEVTCGNDSISFF